MQVKRQGEREIRTGIDLPEIYALGGSPCAGKSSIAERLASQHNLIYYKIDDHEMEHLKSVDPESQPIMHKYSQMSWEEIWMRPVELQVREEFQFYRERFSMILADLAKLAGKGPVITEGAALLPELVRTIGLATNRIYYLVPTKEFQLKYYSKRGFIKGILAQCSDPKQAFANWMERDYLFGKQVIAEAKHYQMKYLLVDGKASLQQNMEIIEEHFEF